MASFEGKRLLVFAFCFAVGGRHLARPDHVDPILLQYVASPVLALHRLNTNADHFLHFVMMYAYVLLGRVKSQTKNIICANMFITYVP